MMDIKQINKIKTGQSAMFSISLILLIFLAGCVTLESESPQPSDNSLSAIEIDDVGRGFVITETAQLEESSRTDFEEAVLLLNEEEYEKAIEILERVIEQSPEVTAPYIDLGIAYQRTGNQEKAEAQFKNALELFPGHPVACNQYGLLLRKSGKFDEARSIYEQALTGYPSYYPVHRNLGILYDLYLNDPSKALEHYEIYNGYVPEDDKVKIWIADLRIRLGIDQ
jgi:tetratricopeptide (TPR) repeat protein